jgi:predicted peptidase
MASQKDLKLKQYLPQDVSGIDRTVWVMTAELGRMVGCLLYAVNAERRGDPNDKRVYSNSARIECSDLITQCRVLTEQMGWSWEELLADGEERFKERMKELSNKEI